MLNICFTAHTAPVAVARPCSYSWQVSMNPTTNAATGMGHADLGFGTDVKRITPGVLGGLT